MGQTVGLAYHEGVEDVVGVQAVLGHHQLGRGLRPFLLVGADLRGHLKLHSLGHPPGQEQLLQGDEKTGLDLFLDEHVGHVQRQDPSLQGEGQAGLEPNVRRPGGKGVFPLGQHVLP